MVEPKTSSMVAPGPIDPHVGTASLAPQAATNDRESQPVSADMQALIGRQLRAVFDDIAKQPVPDRFLELMRQLEAKSSGVA